MREEGLEIINELIVGVQKESMYDVAGHLGRRRDQHLKSQRPKKHMSYLQVQI